MKKFLKITGVFLVVFLLLALGASIALVDKFPSAWDLENILSPHHKKPSAKDEELKSNVLKALQNNLLNENRPMAALCKDLPNVTSSQFLNKKGHASAHVFFEKINDDIKDPLVESVAPIFRYLVRFSNFRDVVEDIIHSKSTDESLFKKLSFYMGLALNYKDLYLNKKEIDLELMKSYHLFIFVKAIKLHPEIMADEATQSECKSLEADLNKTVGNVDIESTELQNFLKQAHINATEVDYNPYYRSDLKLGLDLKEVIEKNNIWLVQIFSRDIEKAEVELEKESE